MSVFICVLLALLAGTVIFLIRFFIAKEFYKAATAKGWNSRRYFWLPFLLGLVGYLLVIALPDRGGQYMSALISEDLPEL